MLLFVSFFMTVSEDEDSNFWYWRALPGEKLSSGELLQYHMKDEISEYFMFIYTV